MVGDDRRSDEQEPGDQYRIDLPLREREAGSPPDVLQQMEEKIREEAPKQTKIGGKWLSIERTRDHEGKRIALEALAKIKELELQEERQRREADLADRKHADDVALRLDQLAIDDQHAEADRARALAEVINAIKEAHAAGLQIDIGAARVAGDLQSGLYENLRILTEDEHDQASALGDEHHPGEE